MLLARIFIPALILYFIPGCINNGNENRERDLRNEVQKSTIAEKFSIEKKDGYSILTIINPWQGASNVLHKWYLVKKGSPVPQGIDGKDVIPVPVRSIICMSTTYIPMIKALGREGTIKGISGTSLIYDDSVRTMVNSGEIADVGYEDNLNKELLIKISPELLITYGVGSEASGYMNKVRDLGIKVMFNADYLETDPLAKAEWIKVFGALYGCEKEADDIFSDIQKRYLELMVFVKTGQKCFLDTHGRIHGLYLPEILFPANSCLTPEEITSGRIPDRKYPCLSALRMYGTRHSGQISGSIPGQLHP
jgi:iron complex transport system substrate-binding protein